VSRFRAPFVAQGTWRQGALCVWGWNGTDPAGVEWLYGGFGSSRWATPDAGWRYPPVAYGEVVRFDLPMPGGPTRVVSAVRLSPYNALMWLPDDPHDEVLSPSLAWFTALARLAAQLLSTKHLRPTLVRHDGATEARWARAATAEIETLVTAFDACMPPVCLLGAPAGTATADVLDGLVDGMCRELLRGARWRPDLPRSRDPHVQAARAIGVGLAQRDTVVAPIAPAVRDEVERLRHVFDRHGRRLAGEPALAPRVRLTLPDDPGDDWLVTLELVDEADPGRWCTAADVWAASPLAVDLVGDAAHLATMGQVLLDAAHDAAESVACLAPLVSQDQPTEVVLDLAGAADFLNQAPFELDRRGIGLIGPEHLVRASVRVRGRATPAPADDRQRRFGREALVEWTAIVDDTPVTEADLARAEAAGASLMHLGHRWVRLDPEGLRRARKLLDDHLDRHSVVDPLTLLRLAGDPDDTDGDEAVSVSVQLDSAATDEPGWVESLLAGLPDELLGEVVEPTTFKGELRHYQRRGLAWLQFLARLGLGGCLADDMGLGKTATTLAHLVDRPGPHLVICPLSVVHNWEAEAARFTPGLRTVVHHGSERHRDPDGAFEPGPDHLVLTTYGLVARDLGTLAAVEWSTVVLDEAQMVKNPGTKAAKAVRQLRAGQKIALTGTPVENRLAELWSLLDAVNPGLLGSQARFRRKFASPIERDADPKAIERLRQLTRPFVLRRTKADRTLLPELPDKIEQIAYAQLTREQAVLYQRVVDDLLRAAEEETGMRRRGQVLAALTRLKQVCNHPAHALRDGSRLAGRSGKLNRFDELVEELLDVGERALVFTQFREMGELLVQHVAERFGIRAPFLHGGVARARRTAMVAAFQGGSAPPLLLVSLKAGGTGLNLTAASHVIHYDRWWNPAVEDQATDRAWRIGQEQTVNVHKLVCQGTIEERIGQVIDEKRQLADAVIGAADGEAWLSELSTQQLHDLVVLDRTVVR
jgi:SNF2 family DNA or RNA helicase